MPGDELICQEREQVGCKDVNVIGRELEEQHVVGNGSNVMLVCGWR